MTTYLVLFSVSALLSLLLGYPVRALALRAGVVDRPAKRKMHQIPIPLLGGLAIFASFAAVSCYEFMLREPLQDGAARSFLGLLAGASVVVALGVLDDVLGLKASTKFAGQTLAALVVVAMGARIDWFTNPLGESFHLGWIGMPLAVLWIVGITNSVNLIDGLDGLAAGIGGIASLGLFAVAVGGNAFVAGVTVILAGAILGFLRHNFYPARLFLGDTGSMLIGFILAVVGLHGSYKATTATVLFLPIIVLGVPILDTLFAILRRAKRRVNPFKADREHVHHRLVRIGLHHRNVVLVLYFVCAYLALTAYSIAQFPYQTALLFVVLLTMGGIIGLRTIQFLEERLEMGIESRGRPMAEPHGTGAATARGSQPRSSTRRRPADSSTLVCEVGGLREGFGGAEEIAGLCADISSMLSRRVRVHTVFAEPSAPGHMILLVRTESMTTAMAALVQDGVAWYLEDHRERLSGDSAFPVIHWIRTAPPPSRGADDGTTRGAREGSEAARPVILGEGRAGVVGSG